MNNISIIDDSCVGCNSCEQSCPNHAIEMISNQEGFVLPNIDYNMCSNCGHCLNKCPVYGDKSMLLSEPSFQKKVYGAFCTDETIRRMASSGAIFAVGAQLILSKHGVVYGAAYNDDLSVQHIRVDNKNDLVRLYKSKYVQSRLVDCFAEVKKDLENGRLVYFTGTPCQIGALKKHLENVHANLITQEIICHGVPSPLVWRNYLREISRRRKSSLKSVDFRYKENSWIDGSIEYTFSNEKVARVKKNNDVYFRGFNDSLFLRKSCYDCQFKEQNSCSDISLGDFWAVNELFPAINDDKGVSLVFVNTSIGQRFFDDLKQYIRYVPVDYELVCKKHSMIRNSADNLSKRQLFFEKYNENKLGTSVNKLSHKIPKIHRIKYKIKQLLRI